MRDLEGMMGQTRRRIGWLWVIPLFLIVAVAAVAIGGGTGTGGSAPAAASDPSPSSHPGVGSVPYSSGVAFRVWAPFATNVAVAGDFNGWSSAANPLASEGSGYWSADVPGAAVGQQYRFVVTNGSQVLWRNDPRGRQVTNSVGNSVIADGAFDWGATPVLFADGFEGASLNPAWSVSGLGPWSVALNTKYKASGQRGVVLSGKVSASWETSRLTLGVAGAATLSFKIRNVGDEKHAQDGIFVSPNGASWTKLAGFPNPSTSWSATTLALPAGTGFVRFQQYDNYPLPSDGVAIDDVVVSGAASSYATPKWNDAVIYEMHVGTFNDAPGGGPGTFETAIQKLDSLKDLGVNAIEVLPIAEFAGDFSWGYNPAYPYAVESAYGGPKGFKNFVKEAHARGIAVLVDVVYNHLGPSDLDLWRFDGWSQDGKGGIYFYNDWRSSTPWGDTRPDFGRGEVRGYLRDNVMMWLDEYRADGLRWDSTLNIRSSNGADIPDGWSLMQWIHQEIAATSPWKISIAEDLQGDSWITKSTGSGGAGFDAQWDAGFVFPVRGAITTAGDADRNMFAVRDAISGGTDRVIYTESHDEVANGKSRVPEEIWPGNAGSWHSRKRSTLGAALVLTSPGIPMIFQGQEILEDGWFSDADPVDWNKAITYSGIRQMYRDMIRLRRNAFGTTRGLAGSGVTVHHVDNQDKVIAFHRWDQGGAGDDVVVVVNMSDQSFTQYALGFPKGGLWRVRFNGDWKGYGADFGNHYSYDTVANWGAKDGMAYSGNVGIGPYSAVILSQDP